MGIWHGIMALLIALAAAKAFGNQSGVPYRVEIETMWKTVDFELLKEVYPSMFDPMCNQINYVSDETKDVFDWFTCQKEHHGDRRDSLRAKMANVTKHCPKNMDNPLEEKGLGSMYQPVRTVLHEFPLWFLLFSFEFITSFFHLMLYSSLWNPVYNELLEKGIQPFRWVEYSITSRIMLVCIFSLSKLLELYATLSLFFNSAFTQLGGGLAWEICTYVQKQLIPPSKHEKYHPVPTLGDVKPIQARQQRGTIWILSPRWFLQTPLYRTLDLLRFSMYALSWITFALSYAAIFHAFYTILSPYYDLETGVLWKELFFFIEVLNLTILVLYATFPVLHLIQIFRRDWYVEIELGYLFASMISKTFLIGIIFAAALQRHD